MNRSDTITMENEATANTAVPLRQTAALFALGSCALLNVYATQPILPDIATGLAPALAQAPGQSAPPRWA